MRQVGRHLSHYSWKTVVLIAGMLPLATALTKTGATDLMAKELVAALGSLGPIAMLVVAFLVTALVGLFVSNWRRQY